MNASTDKIAVTLCCSEEDLGRARSLAFTLRHEALDVDICSGVDLDANALEPYMAPPRSPGAFVLCESLDLDAYQLPEIETRFDNHKIGLDQLVHVNLETETAEQILERIRSAVATLAGDEQTINASSAKPADISDAIALAARLVEENAARTQATAQAQAAPVPAPKPAATPKPEPEPTPAAQPAPQSKRGGLVAVAAVLGVAVVAGLGWFAWDSGMFGPSEPTAAASPSPAPDASEPAAPARPDPAPEDAAPEAPSPDPVVLAATEPSAVNEDLAEPPAPDADAEALADAEQPPEVSPDEADIVVPPAEPTRAAPKLGAVVEHEGLLIAPVTDVKFYWRDASNHCRLNRRDGKLGWRMASIKQLRQFNKAGLLEPGTYWSTTLAVVGGTKNLVFDTNETRPRGEGKEDFEALALCVYQTQH